MKQLSVDPWTDGFHQNILFSKHKGVIRNSQNFGVFVELEEGIDD